jgi:hypothetical protein
VRQRTDLEEDMTETETLIAKAYSAFNHRNIEGALALMQENISWPKASEGGRAVGKAEIRAYWSRQWEEFDPHVDPLEVLDRGAGGVQVLVHQVVKSLAGELLADGEVWHVYVVTDGLIERMDLGEGEGSAEQAPSAAFAQH